MVQEGKPAAEAFPLPAAGGSEVMNRPVLYCARCGAEIQTRHIVWQINRWPAAVDIRALQLYALPVRHETATALVRRRPTKGPHPDAGRWVRYPAITPRYRFYKRWVETARLLFGGTPQP